MEYRGVILGNTPSKSNCYRVGKIGNKCNLYKGKALKAYEKAFELQVPSDMKGLLIDQDFQFYVEVYYPSLRSDLDNSLKVVLDCLQKAEVIKNDNKCKRIEAYKYKDKENPRIEFVITLI